MDEGTSLGDWAKVGVLGSGSFGVVTLWRDMKTNDTVAIKKCRFEQPQSIPKKQRERWTQEVDFMRSVQHANIVGYKQLPNEFLAQLDRFNLSRLPLLPMEYCSGGNLRRLLNKPEHACGLREPDVRRVLEDISSAVSYLHRKQITHRDIKPENVVLQNGADRKVIYKLIDLGYAKDMNLMMSFVGTMAYTAPEIFKNENYNHNVDYWSFGTMVYEICCGKHPFIPKVQPFERFKHIEKKGPRDICVYQSSSSRIISTDKIFEPNHISPCLRTHLEDWLSAMLQYNSADRGRTQSGVNVFTVLKSILDKQILHVFAVYNYSHHYFEINSAHKLHHLQHLIQESTGLVISDQLILTSLTHVSKMDFYNKLKNPNASLMFDLGLSGQSTLIVFKKNEFVHQVKIMLPAAVKSLMSSTQMPWELLALQTSQAIHYIGEEANKMGMISVVVDELFEFLKIMLCGQDELLPRLRMAGLKALQTVEFCMEMNSDCWYDRSKVAAIKHHKKQLWRVRELVENANAAIARFLKARSRTRLLKVSMDKVMHWLDEFDINSIYEEAAKFMRINNQKKAVITPEGISKAICTCLKTRKEIQQDQMIVQHINLCFKVLREHDKLTRWMKSLTDHLGAATVDLLDSQKQLSRSEGQTLRAESESSWTGSERTLNGGDHVDIHDGTLLNNGNVHQDLQEQEDLTLPTVDDLITDNRTLRCRMQDVLGDLLSTHKSHAISVGEFVVFVDKLCIEDAVSHASNKSTDV